MRSQEPDEMFCAICDRRTMSFYCGDCERELEAMERIHDLMRRFSDEQKIDIAVSEFSPTHNSGGVVIALRGEECFQFPSPLKAEAFLKDMLKKGDAHDRH